MTMMYFNQSNFTESVKPIECSQWNKHVTEQTCDRRRSYVSLIVFSIFVASTSCGHTHLFQDRLGLLKLDMEVVAKPGYYVVLEMNIFRTNLSKYID